MSSNPYQSPEFQGENTVAKPNHRKLGYFQVSLGYALLGAYVFAAWYLTQLTNSTGQLDRGLALEYSPWLVPFVVLIPWLSLLAVRNGNKAKIRINAAILFAIYLLCSALIALSIV
jgi:hypothetical protein